MKYVLIYESAEDVADQAPLYFAAHKARWTEFHEAGTLLLIGPYADRSGALAVFTSREAAEEFARADPFVLYGLIRDWSVKEWAEALGKP
jgi:uncharacterized protein YciI